MRGFCAALSLTVSLVCGCAEEPLRRAPADAPPDAPPAVVDEEPDADGRGPKRPAGEPPRLPVTPDDVVVEAERVRLHELDGTSWNPLVAVDGAGAVLAVWLQTREAAPYHALWSRRMDEAGAWSAPEQVTDWGAAPTRLSLAAGEAGAAVLAWASSSKVSAVRMVAGVWQEPTTVDIESGQYVAFVEATIEPDGDAAVFFSRMTQATGFIESIGNTHGIWHAPQTVVEDTFALWDDGVAIARDDAGRALVVWARTAAPGADVEVRARRGAPGEGSVTTLVFGDVEEIGTLAAPNAPGLVGVDAFLAGDGDAAIVLTVQSDADTIQLHESRAAPGATFSAPTLVVSDIPAQFGFSTIRPRVAASPSGEMVAVWREGAGTFEDEPSPSRLVAARYAPSAGWGAPAIVADGLAPAYFGCAMPPADFLDVAIDDDGEAVVLFEDRGADVALGAWGAPLYEMRVEGAEAPSLVAEIAAPGSARTATRAQRRVVAWLADEEMDGSARTALWASISTP